MDKKKAKFEYALAIALHEADLWGKGNIVVGGQTIGEVSHNSDIFRLPEPPVGKSPLEDAPKIDVR